MNSPFAAPALLAAGLVFLFSGERLFGDDPAYRIVLDVLGVAGLAGSMVSRGRGRAGLPDEIKSWIAAVHVGFVVALLLYVIQLPTPLAKLGFTTGDSEKAARAVLGTLWPIVMAVSTLAAFFLDTALVSSRRMPALEVMRLRASAQTGTVLGLLVAIFAVSNYLVQAHSPEWDLSRRKVGRPSEATLEIAKNLESPVFFNVFFPPSNDVEEEIRPYLQALERGSQGKVLVHNWDHALDPKIAKRVNARDNGAIYMTRQSLEEGLEQPEPPPVTNEKLQLGLKAESAKSTLKKFDAELQKKLLKLSRGSRKIYFTSGHGERNARGGSNVDKEDGRGKLSLMNRYLATQSYEVKLLSAADGLSNEVPADAAALVIAGPTDAFLDSEIEAIQRYFDGGGSVMILLEHGASPEVTAKLLAHLGLTYDPTLVANDRIFAVETRQASDRVLLATNKTTSHPSVTTLSRNRDQLYLAVPKTGSLAKAEGTTRNVQLVINAMPGAWKDADGDFLKDKEENAAGDKISLVAAVEGEKKDGKSPKALVTASASMIEDKWIRVDGNLVFLADAIKWLAGDEKLQAPVALADEDIPIKHTRKEDTIWFYATIFVFPALVLGGGLGYIQRSRRRKGSADKGATK